MGLRESSDCLWSEYPQAMKSETQASLQFRISIPQEVQQKVRACFHSQMAQEVDVNCNWKIISLFQLSEFQGKLKTRNWKVHERRQLPTGKINVISTRSEC